MAGGLTNEDRAKDIAMDLWLVLQERVGSDFTASALPQDLGEVLLGTVGVLSAVALATVVRSHPAYATHPDGVRETFCAKYLEAVTENIPAFLAAIKPETLPRHLRRKG